MLQLKYLILRVGLLNARHFLGQGNTRNSHERRKIKSVDMSNKTSGENFLAWTLTDKNVLFSSFNCFYTNLSVMYAKSFNTISKIRSGLHSFIFRPKHLIANSFLLQNKPNGTDEEEFTCYTKCSVLKRNNVR